ncbi:MAG: rane protein, partial [Herbaspirillum sp.]|nr:rane protein [Herbaspirillum sp.]
MNERQLILTGAINMFIAVAAGAFGAHGLKQVLSAEMLAIWQTAVTYQMAHALGLFAVALLLPRLHSSLAAWAGRSMLIGIMIFSGSL